MAKESMIVEEGLLGGVLPYLAFGQGEPLVMIRTLTSTRENPKGLARLGEMNLVKPLTHNFKVYLVSRNPSKKHSANISDYTAEYAQAIHDTFDGSVIIMGVSTGGSLAQQFAIDYPHLVNKLVLEATAAHLSDLGKQVQTRYADFLAKGDSRGAVASLAPVITKSKVSAFFVHKLLWLLEPLQGKVEADQMVELLRAEDTFDSEPHLHKITAPTLLIVGERDEDYSIECARTTAAKIPKCQLIVRPGAGHRELLTHPNNARDILAFLQF